MDDYVGDKSIVIHSGEESDNNINAEEPDVYVGFDVDDQVGGNSNVIHFGEESDNNINTVEEFDVDEGLDVHDHVGEKLKESVNCRETHSPYSESTDESDEHSPQPTLRKSGRARKAPVIFTYDQVGGDPRITRRHFR